MIVSFIYRSPFLFRKLISQHSKKCQYLFVLRHLFFRGVEVACQIQASWKLKYLCCFGGNEIFFSFVWKPGLVSVFSRCYCTSFKMKGECSSVTRKDHSASCILVFVCRTIFVWYIALSFLNADENR